MSDSAIIIRDGDEVHRLQITHRDWMLISGPGFVEGPAFTSAFGIFENFTVARGMPKGSLVHRDGQTLFDASSTLLAGIKRDLDLLRYDYSYKIADQPKQFGGGQSISVDGRSGILSLRPKGYCLIRFVDRKPPDLMLLHELASFGEPHVGPDRDGGPGGDVSDLNVDRALSFGQHPEDEVPVGDQSDQSTILDHRQHADVLALHHPCRIERVHVR